MACLVRITRLILTSSAMTKNNIPFVLSLGGTASELYEQYLNGLTHMLDKHAPIISRMAQKQSLEWWLSELYCMAALSEVAI